MNEQLTEIICVIDRSGSMDATRSDAIGGFNAFLNEQKKLPGDARLSLVLFDDQYEVVLDGAPIGEVLELTQQTYVPRGMTALLDAVGRTVDYVGIRLAETPEEKRPAKVILCILTDGEENSSKEYTRDQVFQKITKHTENNGWEFIFLAANQDAIQTGQSMGIDADSSVSFDATAPGISAAYSELGDRVTRSRSHSEQQDPETPEPDG